MKAQAVQYLSHCPLLYATQGPPPPHTHPTSHDRPPHSRLTCYSLSVLGIKGLVNLVKQVEGGRVTLLNGKDEGQSHQRFLSPGQLLHVAHLCFVACEGHLERERTGNGYNVMERAQETQQGEQ